jgi:hypothetical protein
MEIRVPAPPGDQCRSSAVASFRSIRNSSIGVAPVFSIFRCWPAANQIARLDASGFGFGFRSSPKPPDLRARTLISAQGP